MSPPNFEERFYTPPKAARIMGTGSDHVLALIRSGELKASNLSLSDRPRWKINPVDLQAFLDRRSNQASTKSAQPQRRAIPKPSKEYV